MTIIGVIKMNSYKLSAVLLGLICIILFLPVTNYGQTNVFFDEIHSAYDLRKVFPEWISVVDTRIEADWIIHYDVINSSQESMNVKLGFWDRMQKKKYLLDKLETISQINITLSNTHTGLQRSYSVSENLTSEDMVTYLRDAAGDTEPPVFIVSPLSEEQIIFSDPIMTLNTNISDDIGVSNISIDFEDGRHYEIDELGEKSHQRNLMLPLEIGDNKLKISVEDLYNRSTTKIYSVFRTHVEQKVKRHGFKVTTDTAQLRSGPNGGDSKKTGSFQNGDLLAVLDYTNGWVKVTDKYNHSESSGSLSDTFLVYNLEELLKEELIGWVELSDGVLTQGDFGSVGKTDLTNKISTGPTDYPPLLSIENIAFLDESADNYLDAGEGGVFSFRIKNEGKGPAEQLVISLQMPETAAIGLSPIDVPTSVAPNSSVNVSYKLIGAATLGNKTLTVGIDVIEKSSPGSTKPMLFRVKTRARWPDVDIDIPLGNKTNFNGIAVIVGNHTYDDPSIYPVKFAKQDAEAVKNYVVKTLGFLEENIVYIENASFAELRSIFGTETEDGKLSSLVFPDQSDVFIYYSGHGVPGMNDQRGYLLPTNVRAEDANSSGYSLGLLGTNLSKLQAKSITLVVDACFSGLSEEGNIIKDASPVYIDVSGPFTLISNGTSFFATGGKEIASWHSEQKHGLFTYYFLKGLRGEADIDKNNNVTVSELEKYLMNYVPYQARKLYDRRQTPFISTSQEERVIVDFGQ